MGRPLRAGRKRGRGHCPYRNGTAYIVTGQSAHALGLT